MGYKLRGVYMVKNETPSINRGIDLRNSDCIQCVSLFAGLYFLQILWGVCKGGHHWMGGGGAGFCPTIFFTSQGIWKALFCSPLLFHTFSPQKYLFPINSTPQYSKGGPQMLILTFCYSITLHVNDIVRLMDKI